MGEMRPDVLFLVTFVENFFRRGKSALGRNYGNEGRLHAQTKTREFIFC